MKILFIILLTTTALIAQVDSFLNTTVTKIEIPKKKVRNREFITKIYYPNVSSSSKGISYWTFPYAETKPGDSTYFTYQNYNRYTPNFTGTRGLSFLFSKIKTINPKYNFKYGFGVDIFGFGYEEKKEVLEKRVLKKVVIIKKSVSENVEETEINREYNDAYPSKFNLYTPFYPVTASISVPLSLEYHWKEKYSLGFTIETKLPISSSIASYYYSYSQKRNLQADVESNIVSRIIINPGLYMNYKVYKNIFVGLNVNAGNLINASILKTMSELRAVKNPIFYSYGLNFGITY